MKSKPVYTTLTLDTTARRHLFLTQGAGKGAAARALAEHPAADVVVLDMPDMDDPQDLNVLLAEAGMDTAFYVAGSEVFLWQTANVLCRAGIEGRRIQQELAGSQARTVYCVHCRTLNEGVTTTIHRCTGCGMALTVRDHFSRPLGAYAGVIVDAEAPGVVPEPETAYV